MSRFPVTATDKVTPGDPKDEPTREWVMAHPEGLIERVLRTRRYFRLLHQNDRPEYAQGLDTEPTDFA